MNNIVLYCKSYKRDVLRVKRLIDSIEKYNIEDLSCYLSVPEEDVALFRNIIGSGRCELVADEEIITSNPKVVLKQTHNVLGGLSQQVVKSEFWRLGLSDHYLCLDSDAQFIKNFGSRDFVAADGTPYTVCHQNKELLQMAENLNKHKIVDDYAALGRRAKSIFRRSGPNYDFGPSPMVWSSKVWSDLAEKYLEPQGWTFWDAIKFFPVEICWYGEALLQYKSISLYPVEPLFRIYHYDWQYFELKKQGETLDKLRDQYLGVVYQSNWEYELDYGGSQKSLLSKASRGIRRQLRRIR